MKKLTDAEIEAAIKQAALELLSYSITSRSIQFNEKMRERLQLNGFTVVKL